MSKAEEHVLPVEITEERIDDIRRWTAAGLGAQNITKLLEIDRDGLLLRKIAKNKVSLKEVHDSLVVMPPLGRQSDKMPYKEGELWRGFDFFLRSRDDIQTHNFLYMEAQRPLPPRITMANTPNKPS